MGLSNEFREVTLKVSPLLFTEIQVLLSKVIKRPGLSFNSLLIYAWLIIDTNNVLKLI